MKSQTMNAGLVVVAMITLLAIPASAQQLLEIHFNDVPDVSCNEAWIQDGVSCFLTETTAEDCDGGGNCSFDTHDGIGLFPARLVVEFGESILVHRIEVDFTDYCGVGCSQTFLYNDGLQVASDSNDTVGDLEILLMDLGPDGVIAQEMAVSSCEGFLSPDTIRIQFDTILGAEDTTWDHLKATYR